MYYSLEVWQCSTQGDIFLLKDLFRKSSWLSEVEIIDDDTDFCVGGWDNVALVGLLVLLALCKEHGPSLKENLRVYLDNNLLTVPSLMQWM